MKNILVDTSVLIDFLRMNQKKDTRLFSLIQQEYFLNISIITHTELYAGKSVWEKSHALKELNLLFSGLTIIPLSLQISENAGKLRAKYSLDLLDALIVATALDQNMPLSTINKKHFKKVEGVELI